MTIGNRKCSIIDNGSTITKIYLNQDSFQKECCVYKKMNNKDFIPKLVNIDKSKREITMEKILWKNLFDFVDQNKKIPLNLLEELKRIRLEFLKNHFMDFGDFFDYNHIYVSKMDSKGFCSIKVIDFDKVEKVKIKDIQDHVKKIKGDFECLNIDKEKFKEIFYWLNDDIINNFFENKKEV